ncbi:MAG: glycosyltransferase family 4 protein [Candidatus Rokubacteria bacterium]|nr:glycosyltransferase family 4 protein [Candidatus Rokubacteria bacterium]
MTRSGPLAMYVSYDGVLEPLGQSQILPYLRGLAREGLAFLLLTFEKPADLRRRADVDRLRAELAALGIQWWPLRYHRRPSVPATAWDVARGVALALWLACSRRPRVVHCRSYVAAVIGLAVHAVAGPRFIFDMRGFWPEERVEGGVWPAAGGLFRAAKRVERWLLRASDAVIVLTERARRTLATGRYQASLRPGTPIEVIPCCVEVERFAGANCHDGAPGPERTIVYAGSVGTWYMLEEMLDFFAAVRSRDPGLRFLLLNRGEHDAIRRAAGARDLDGVEVRAASPAEMPAYLGRAFAGLYFIKPVFSKTGASPTKLGEYLAAGLPVIVNAGVGDADEVVTDARVGVVVDRFAPDAYVAAWDALTRAIAADPGLRPRCRETARRALGLEQGVARYRRVYERLLEPAATLEGSPR